MAKNHMIDYLAVAVPLALALLWAALTFLPFSWRKPREASATRSEAPRAIAVVQPPQERWGADAPLGLVVRDLNGGMATVVMHERTRFKKCKALLIVWTGKKHKRRKVLNSLKIADGSTVLIEDSPYDLGWIESPTLGMAEVEEFLERAKQKLVELAAEGKEKQRRKKKSVAPVDQLPETPAVQPEATPKATADDAQTGSGDVADARKIELKRFASVLQGKVLEIGLLEYPGKNEPYPGVRIQRSDGTEEVVWGKYLRTAFSEAGAGVGDHVEIIKTGRKHGVEGKTPMNLYQVAKLQPEQLVAH